MDDQGKAIIFSAPSGAGKTTIVHYLLNNLESLKFSVSATSRPQRGDEKNGVDYHYLTPDTFHEKVSDEEFIEWEEVYRDHLYGTLKSEIEKIWKSGNHIIFDVDVVGGMNLKKYFGDRGLAIFVKPPSLAHLKKRLESRKTESPDKIALRMAKSSKEMAHSKDFDYILLNDELDRACNEAMDVVQSFLTH